MKNMPDVKIGIVVGSTDWLPSKIAEQNRKLLIDAYVSEYGSDSLY